MLEGTVMKMTKEELFTMMNENPAFHLATVEGDQPHVRGMLLFRADENGIIFHTASSKNVCQQIRNNPKAELCFQAKGTQIRVMGELEEIPDEALKEEIRNHPTRQFLKAWEDMGIDFQLTVFCLKNGKATTWTMETNFAEKEWIEL